MNIHWQPQPKQSLALQSSADEILYGGARGGGKTDAGQAFLLYDIDKSYYRALVVRRNYTDLTDWIDRAQSMYAAAGGKLVGDKFKFPSGAQFQLGHLQDATAFQKYQGHEYHKMLIEELSHIAREKDYQKLVSSCRSKHADIKPQVFCTTNPDDPGLDWIKDRWDIPDEPDFDQVYTTKKTVEVDGETLSRRLVFIPAKLEDNPILVSADPGYVVQLELLKETDPETYQAWRHGSWTGRGVEGSYYAAQLLKAEEEGRIGKVAYDPALPVHTWCDIGLDDDFAVGYFQVDTRGMWKVIDYDEFNNESLEDLAERFRNKGYNFGKHFAPHDIMTRDVKDNKSRWEFSRSLGIEFEHTADLNGKIQSAVPRLSVHDGINALKMRFNSLMFDEEKCAELLKHLRRYHKEFDEKRGKWKNNPVHDQHSHASDMMRYWAVTSFVFDERDYMEARVQQNRQSQGSFR